MYRYHTIWLFTAALLIAACSSDGTVSEEPAVEFASSDIDLVMSQTGCDRAKAIEALTAVNGQPAEAILKIMTE